MIDTAIIGGGPSALAAAIYLARAGKDVTVFERGEIGGELNRIDKIENYPGFKGAGSKLAATMRKQAEDAGARVVYGECTWATHTDTGFTLMIDDDKVSAKSVLVATGSEPRQLKVKPKKPVSYCALCDGALVEGQKVVVVGGGNSALQAVLYLAPLASEVTLICHSKIKADTYLYQKVDKLKNVTLKENIEPTAEMLDEFDHIFVFIGTRPATGWLKSLSKEKAFGKESLSLMFLELEVIKEYRLLDDNGYVLTGGKKRSPHATQIPGVFAAGDVRSGATKQVVTAVGDGAMAANEIATWLGMR